MDFHDLIAPFPEKTRRDALVVRAFLQQNYPDLREQLDPASKLAAYNLAPGMPGIVFTLLLSKTGVKLGINRGSELEDWSGLLRGTGKVHKYLPITKPSHLDDPLITNLLKSAVDAARLRIQARTNG